MEGFLRYEFGGDLDLGGRAYTWRGIFLEFYSATNNKINVKKIHSEGKTFILNKMEKFLL